MRRLFRAILLTATVVAVTACSPKNVKYISDAPADKSYQVTVEAIKVQPYDKLSIVIGTRSPEITSTVNLPYVAQRIGSMSNLTSGINGYVSCYTVDSKGEIDLPELGKLKVAGLTREAIAERVGNAYKSKGILSDMTVTVEFVDFYVSVAGEVTKPGRYAIERDKTTILDALSMAGDLTIMGRRDNVAVVRHENGREMVYRVNLCSADSLFSSPAYQIKQNDYIYVEPNNVRVRQSTVNGNNVLSTSFWLSLASLLVTIAVLIKK